MNLESARSSDVSYTPIQNSLSNRKIKMMKSTEESSRSDSSGEERLNTDQQI